MLIAKTKLPRRNDAHVLENELKKTSLQEHDRNSFLK